MGHQGPARQRADEQAPAGGEGRAPQQDGDDQREAARHQQQGEQPQEGLHGEARQPLREHDALHEHREIDRDEDDIGPGGAGAQPETEPDQRQAQVGGQAGDQVIALDAPGGLHQGDQRIAHQVHQQPHEGQAQEGGGVGRHFVGPQPQVQQQFGLPQHGDEEGQDHEPGILGAFVHEAEAVVPVPRGPALGDLGIDRRQEIGDELLDDPLHLQGHPPRGIHRHAEEEVGHLVDALGIEHIGARAEETPAREGGHLPHQHPVPKQAPAGFRETPPAIQAVGQTHQHGDPQHQDGIADQLVERRNVQQQRHAQLEQGLAQADHGEGRHPLVGDDRGVVRNREQADHQHAQRALQHPAGGVQAPVRNVQAVVQPPHAGRLHQQHQQQGEPQLDDDAGRKDTAQARGIALGHVRGQVAADGRGERGGQEGEHGHHPAHDIVGAVIVDAQGPEHHARGEQADEHQQEHTEIQQEGIAGNPPAVFRKLSCSLRHELFGNGFFALLSLEVVVERGLGALDIRS